MKFHLDTLAAKVSFYAVFPFFYIVALSYSAPLIAADPGVKDRVSSWLAEFKAQAKQIDQEFPRPGYLYSWLRQDTWDYTAAEAAQILRDADKHPQATANTTAFYLRAAQRHGAVRTTNRLWAGEDGLRHSIDMGYSDTEPFVDMASRRDGAWSLTRSGVNLLPPAGSDHPESRVAQGFGGLSRQDLIAQFTAGVHELSRRPAGDPVITVAGTSWSAVFPIAEPDALASIEITGTWDEEASRAEIRSTVMNSRRVPGATARWTFEQWTDAGGLRYAGRVNHYSSTLRQNTLISGFTVQSVSEEGIAKVLKDPSGWNTDTGAVRDEVRGELRLNGFVSKRGASPEIYARRGEEIVSGPPPDSEAPARRTRQAGWILGGVIVAFGVAIYAWRRRVSGSL